MEWSGAERSGVEWSVDRDENQEKQRKNPNEVFAISETGLLTLTLKRINVPKSSTRDLSV